MLLLRDQKKAPSQTVLPFGRYKGWFYAETPKGYRQWAVDEVEKNTAASHDLVRYAQWAKGEMEKEAAKGYPKNNLGKDPEAMASVPPPAMDFESDSSSWSRVTGPRTSRKGRRDSDMEEGAVSVNPQQEMLMLERRLEELKRAEKEKNMR